MAAIHKSMGDRDLLITVATLLEEVEKRVNRIVEKQEAEILCGSACRTSMEPRLHAMETREVLNRDSVRVIVAEILVLHARDINTINETKRIVLEVFDETAALRAKAAAAEATRVLGTEMQARALSAGWTLGKMLLVFLWTALTAGVSWLITYLTVPVAAPAAIQAPPAIIAPKAP